jgi:hypothetical protein
MKSTRRRRATAVVPRSLLAGVGMGMGVIPLCISAGASTGCDTSPAIGIEPALGFGAGSGGASVGADSDAGSGGASIGILPAMDFDAGHDAAPIGILPAMDFDAGSDADPGDASAAPDASGMDP